MKNPRPHRKCALCQAHIQSCIYKVFGPCKWMDAEEQESLLQAQQQKSKEQIQERVQAQVELLREDDQLTFSILPDHDSLLPREQQKAPDFFPEL